MAALYIHISDQYIVHAMGFEISPEEILIFFQICQPFIALLMHFFLFFLGAKVLAQLIGGRLDLNEVITDQPKASILQAAWIANDGSFFKSPRRSRALPSDHHGAISSQLHPSCG